MPSKIFSRTEPLNKNIILQHHADMRAQALLRQTVDGMPVDRNSAFLHVVEARKQADHRRLAAAAHADERGSVAMRNRKVDIPQHPFRLVLVTERDILEDDVAPYGRDARPRPANP